MTEIEQIADPECPVEHWWNLAKKHPIEAIKSVLYPLMTLESPDRWHALEQAHIIDWIKIGINRLSAAQQHLFAADCAEQVLPYFEAVYPEDRRPREAIQVHRLFANGGTTPSAWRKAQTASYNAANAANAIATKAWKANQSRYTPAIDALYEATVAAFSAASPAHEAAAHAAIAVLTMRPWQWARLQEYLRGEVA